MTYSRLAEHARDPDPPRPRSSRSPPHPARRAPLRTRQTPGSGSGATARSLGHPRRTGPRRLRSARTLTCLRSSAGRWARAARENQGQGSGRSCPEPRASARQAPARRVPPRSTPRGRRREAQSGPALCARRSARSASLPSHREPAARGWAGSPACPGAAALLPRDLYGKKC